MSRPGTQATGSQAHVRAVPLPPGEEDAGLARARARSLTLPGTADQVPRARAFIARVLAAAGLDGEAACLLGGELVTNSVQHSDSRLPGGTIIVTVAAGPAGILVEVTDDGGPGAPCLRDGVTAFAEGGRGLMLVAALASRWGHHRAGGGLTTWFRVPAQPVPPA
jgi:serine/threonine-protein kinase RsbW